jgi:hypothetical protein
LSNLLTVIGIVAAVVAAVVAAGVVGEGVTGGITGGRVITGAGVVGAGVVGAGVTEGITGGRVGTDGNIALGKIVGCTEYPTGIVILRAFFHRSSVKLLILPEYTAISPLSDIINALFGVGSVR